MSIASATPAALGHVEEVARPGFLRRLRGNPAACAGALVVTITFTVAILAPVLAPYSATQQRLELVAGGCCPGPSSTHPLGVDELGRDVLSRVIYGARYSMIIAFGSVALGLSAGLVLGTLAGGLAGYADALVMRIVDVLLAIPSLLLAIGIVALTGPGLVPVMVAVGVAQIPIFARLLRGTMLGQRNAEYVLAARAIGAHPARIVVRHILPNSLSPVLVAATLAMATAIIEVAGLGFLGLGPQDPATPEWGTMLTKANTYVVSAPLLAVVPGCAIVWLVVGFNLLGDGLREASDPKLRDRA